MTNLSPSNHRYKFIISGIMWIVHDYKQHSMGFGLLIANMEGSLSVVSMGSVINPRPGSASSKYEYGFLS